MPSIVTSSKRLAKHPATRGLAWIIGLGVAAAAAIGGVIYYDEKSSKASPHPVPPGPAPAGQNPVWSLLTPVANPSLPGSYMVTIPAGSSFAFSDVSNDPNLPQIVAGMNAAASGGAITGAQVYQPGTAAPSFWPNDGLGTAGYRASGVVSSALNLSLGALTTQSPTLTPMVWIVTGYQ
jgi:hypothetical protein